AGSQNARSSGAAHADGAVDHRIELSGLLCAILRRVTRLGDYLGHGVSGRRDSIALAGAAALENVQEGAEVLSLAASSFLGEDFIGVVDEHRSGDALGRAGLRADGRGCDGCGA